MTSRRVDKLIVLVDKLTGRRDTYTLTILVIVGITKTIKTNKTKSFRSFTGFGYRNPWSKINV